MIRILAKKYQDAYEKWANKERPYVRYDLDGYLDNPDAVNREGSFREREWLEYTQARDMYLLAIAQAYNETSH